MNVRRRMSIAPRAPRFKGRWRAGNTVLRLFSANPAFKVVVSFLLAAGICLFPESLRRHSVRSVDVGNSNSSVAAFSAIRLQAVVNCTCLVKELADANNPLAALHVNSHSFHRLAWLCELAEARLVYITG